eukprot:TRINITY_DN32848_c0_g1_i1.p1 TRINITY_DN32848_c0_g1~~TRINITY_DN32848_c0_g1_i1.p1  ORF type:complete len:539 (+),score=77.31 TRINITY_DN32848_c0_g1_i1:152-1768(+)
MTPSGLQRARGATTPEYTSIATDLMPQRDCPGKERMLHKRQKTQYCIHALGIAIAISAVRPIAPLRCAITNPAISSTSSKTRRCVALPVLDHGELPSACSWHGRHAMAGAVRVVEDSIRLVPMENSRNVSLTSWQRSLRLLRDILKPEEAQTISELVARTTLQTVEKPDIPVATPLQLLAEAGEWLPGSELAEVVKPIVEDRILPYMRSEFNCPSLVAAEVVVRQYDPNQRLSYRVHFDHNALATAVVDLNPKPGSGLYVGTGPDAASHFFVPFNSHCDAAVHGWDIMHGVRLREDHARVSLIVWAKPLSDAKGGTSSWYVNDALQGDPEASFRAGLSAEQAGKPIAARKFLEAAAESGHAYAMQHLSRIISRHGDKTGARLWLERAADLGFAIAQVNLGDDMRDAGNLEGAMKLYEKAAKQGNEKAQHRLADAYLSGLGAQLDRAKGIHYLRQSASAGKRDAQFAMAELPEVLSTESWRWLKAAAGQGHARALLKCALLEHENGNDAEAIRLLQKAADAGHPWASKQLAALTMATGE